MKEVAGAVVDRLFPEGVSEVSPSPVKPRPVIKTPLARAGRRARSGPTPEVPLTQGQGKRTPPAASPAKRLKTSPLPEAKPVEVPHTQDQENYKKFGPSSTEKAQLRCPVCNGRLGSFRSKALHLLECLEEYLAKQPAVAPPAPVAPTFALPTANRSPAKPSVPQLRYAFKSRPITSFQPSPDLASVPSSSDEKIIRPLTDLFDKPLVVDDTQLRPPSKR